MLHLPCFILRAYLNGAITPSPLPILFLFCLGEHQGADALANIIYRTQAFDMILKYPIPEHLRKLPETPPVIGLQPTVSDIEIDSTSSAARARKEEKQSQLQEAQKQSAAAQALSNNDNKDVEAAEKDPKVEKEEKLERCRMRFRKAVLRENLLIEEEPNIDGEDMYMKLYTPFWRLCIEAQRLRYKVELTVSCGNVVIFGLSWILWNNQLLLFVDRNGLLSHSIYPFGPCVACRDASRTCCRNSCDQGAAPGMVGQKPSVVPSKV